MLRGAALLGRARCMALRPEEIIEVESCVVDLQVALAQGQCHRSTVHRRRRPLLHQLCPRRRASRT